MSNSVNSLFKISLGFVVKHINLVDSFVGFPSLVAEDIFKTFVVEYDTKNKSNEDVLKKFVEAYGRTILKRLNLCRNLLVLNEHFESIIVLSSYITELCVCSCSLGENHEIYNYISKFECLKHLCLEDNSMTDISIRLLTLRIRMYGTGGKEIEYLNLANNHLTDVMIPWLSAFPKLNYLNISGSEISGGGVETLKSLYNLKKTRSDGKHLFITNEGWASILVNKWIDESLRKRVRRNNQYYHKAIISLLKSPRCQSEFVFSKDDLLIFEKEPLLETPSERLLPPFKIQKLSRNCDAKQIEEDIFSQYR